MDDATKKALRALPAVEEVLQHPAAGSLLESYPRPQVVEAVRAAVQEVRQRLVAPASGAAAASGSPVAGPAAEGGRRRG